MKLYSEGQGKGRLPLQPHPKNKTRAVYTKELTHLAVIVAILASRLFHSFRLLLWSVAVLSMACGLWIACFRVLHW